MTDARAHVRITFLSRVWFILSILAFKESFMNGPFFDERDIYFLRPFFSRRRMMSLFEAFLGLRVRKPSAGFPHGVLGLPPGPVLPSPPPCGWSTGFMVEPRTAGRLPSHRERPALPPDSFSCSRLPTWPSVAWQRTWMRRSSVEGMRTTA